MADTKQTDRFWNLRDWLSKTPKKKVLYKIVKRRVKGLFMAALTSIIEKSGGSFEHKKETFIPLSFNTFKVKD